MNYLYHLWTPSAIPELMVGNLIGILKIYLLGLQQPLLSQLCYVHNPT